MHRLLDALREHRHFFIVVALLTLVTTFPTIVYVFKTDVFWHPAGTSHDVYLKFWDVWYSKQFLMGQAGNFYYTELVFFPQGQSLAFHSFSMPHILLVNALYVLLPISNSFSLTFLLFIVLCALSAYVYLLWLFNDKWIALFGAVVFGLSPHVVGHPNHVEIAFIGTIPLAVYCFHRGLTENRRNLVVVAGLLTGLTTIISFYTYICLLIVLGFVVLALALNGWRDKSFWQCVAVLVLSVSLSSIWRIYPMAVRPDSIVEALQWQAGKHSHTDAISYVVNHSNPFFARLLDSLQFEVVGTQQSLTSYLGFVPLMLIGVGLITKATIRKMAPWVFLCAIFLILRLGSHLHINGVDYFHILLPKFYLNQFLPVVFAPFWEADRLMMGALLPLAVLACYGLVALRKRLALAAKPGFVLALAVIVALEYHIPVEPYSIFPLGDGTISKLSGSPSSTGWSWKKDEVRLIHLPMGRPNSKLYSLYQSLSGYPHAEGAIARTPNSAFDYIRANLLLNAWHTQQPHQLRISRSKRVSRQPGGAGGGWIQPHCSPSKLLQLE